MQLLFTPRSHFARKVRILAAALDLPVELVNVERVEQRDTQVFAGNPLMKVPALVDGDACIIDSDHIASYLVRAHDPADRFDVLTTDPDQLNLRAVLNGAMVSEVELLLARRAGMNIRQGDRFAKHFDVLDQSLAWLEDRAALVPEAPSYTGFHLVSLIEHLALFDLVDLGREKLQAHVARLGALPYVAPSRPV